MARSTKRPAQKAQNGVGVARKLLTERQVAEGLRLDSVDVDTLKACSTRTPPRNAIAIVGAMKLRLDYSQSKPKQELLHSGSVAIHVGDPYAESPAAGALDARTIPPALAAARGDDE